MSVELYFHADPEVIQATRAAHPSVLDWSEGLVAHVWFEMPITLRVNDVDILEFKGGPYPAPILGFADFGLRALAGLTSEKQANILVPGDGWVVIRLENSTAVISSSGTRVEARIEVNELVDAWHAFAENVRELLVREFPDLANHLELGRFFRREEWYQRRHK